MPIAQNGMYRCKNCGYKEFRKVDDAMSSPDAFRPCPKCSGFMVKINDGQKGLTDHIREGVGKVFGG